jgi:hypothetical protein
MECTNGTAIIDWSKKTIFKKERSKDDIAKFAQKISPLILQFKQKEN